MGMHICSAVRGERERQLWPGGSAKAVSCEHPVNGSPCGECAMCRSIAAGTSMNVIEMDAASNNGVDDVREIRRRGYLQCDRGEMQGVCIDEVHMLSIGAFNALLKALEGPAGVCCLFWQQQRFIDSEFNFIHSDTIVSKQIQ